MAGCAVIRNGIVFNTIVAEPTDIPPVGCSLVLIPDNVFVTIGFTYDGSNFIDFDGNLSVPAEIVVEELPPEVTE